MDGPSEAGSAEFATVTQPPTRRVFGRLVIALLAGALLTPIVVPDLATAGEVRKRPRVEDVAVAAAADLGDGAPAAVLAALDDGLSLKRVVRRIAAGTLVAAGLSDASTDTTTTSTSSPSSSAEGTSNSVVAITDRLIEPLQFVVDTSSPLIVANRGTKVHVVEIKGTDLQQYSLEPGQVGVYELDGLEPGVYKLRCIVAGHEEHARLTVPTAEPASIRAPVGSESTRFDTAIRVGTDSDTRLTDQDYADVLNWLGRVTDVMVGDGAYLLQKDAREIREQAARDPGARDQAVTADPFRIIKRAQEEGVDPQPALLVNAILLAANNGYDAGQITGFIVDDLLDPKVADSDGEGLFRSRGPFLLAGLIHGVKPNRPPPQDVFQVSRPAHEPVTNDQDDSQGDGGNVAGNYHGRFTGSVLQTLVANYPGATSPTRNAIGITITKNGVMRFVLELKLRAPWVTDDDTVTCASVLDYFATVSPRPRAKLQDDGTFESPPFTTSTQRSDFSGPKCAEIPYKGESDEEVPGLVLVGSVTGDTVRGALQFETEDGAPPSSLEFQAKAFRI